MWMSGGSLMSEGGKARNPSSAGECDVCGKYAEKLYGGMGRYVAMCIDCWRADEPGEARNHEQDADALRRSAYEAWQAGSGSALDDLALRAAAQWAQRIGDGSTERAIDGMLEVRDGR